MQKNAWPRLKILHSICIHFCSFYFIILCIIYFCVRECCYMASLYLFFYFSPNENSRQINCLWHTSTMEFTIRAFRTHTGKCYDLLFKRKSLVKFEPIQFHKFRELMYEHNEQHGATVTMCPGWFFGRSTLTFSKECGRENSWIDLEICRCSTFDIWREIEQAFESRSETFRTVVTSML